MQEDSNWIRVGVAAAISKEREGDLPGYLEQVALFLEQAMPQAVKRKTVGLFKKKLCGLEITFPGERLTLEMRLGTLCGGYAKVSAGIALKTEEVTLAEWTELLTAALEDRASKDDASRDELRRLLGLG